MTKKQRTKIIRIILFVSTGISMFFVPWILVWAWIQPLPKTVQGQLEEAIEHGFDGMIVYVDEAGKAPSFYSAGWHDRAKKIPANPNALFKIASIRKLYVAVAITKLARTGQISLDKTLADYFPELVGRIEHAESISIRTMVQHRSGIPNFTHSPGYWENPPENDAKKLDLVLDLPASFFPGEDYEYSNTNYLLLAELIQRVLGISYHRFIKENILAPHELNQTFSSLKQVDLDDVMSGYYVGVEPDIKTNDYGAMLATAEDVGRFLRALGDGSIFDEEGQAIYSSIYVYEHGGLIPGYQSYAKFNEETNTVVVQFINTTNFTGYDWNLSKIIFNRIEKILAHNKGR